MTERKIERQDVRQEARVLEIEELEKRLEAQIVGVCGDGAAPCVWYACIDVCPPGG
jgi:hypothetical protein